jgi:hypothetical protein
MAATKNINCKEAIRLKKIYRIMSIIFICFTIGLTSFLIYYFENPPTFNLSITIGDFYVEDIDTHEKNYSMYLVQCEIEGVRFSQKDWNLIKNLNFSDPGFEQPSSFLVISTIFRGVTAQDNLDRCDNEYWNNQELPILSIWGFYIDLCNNDTTEFGNDQWFHLSDIIMQQIDMYSEYPYKSEYPSQNIDIEILGAIWNSSSNFFERLIVNYNGIPMDVPRNS